VEAVAAAVSQRANRGHRKTVGIEIIIISGYPVDSGSPN
jgi:hypothetical protein